MPAPTGDVETMWPPLPLDQWDDTRETLFLWCQVVGKVRLALEPMMNHWWQVPLYVSARGLSTSLMHSGGRGVELEMNLLDQMLEVRTSDGERRTVPLQPMSVAAFYGAAMAALDSAGVAVRIHTTPNEIPHAIPFPDDVGPRPYDPVWAERFWRVLLQSQRVLQLFRSRFIGKASPVHFFWGAADLAATRFSGRAAPRHPGGVPNCPDWVQHLAYSHEVHSCGFWPGGSAEGSFYAYAYPRPDGFAEWPVAPATAFFDEQLGEFILPYADVRSAADPDALVLQFCQSTYDAVATLAEWDRPALDASW